MSTSIKNFRLVHKYQHNTDDLYLIVDIDQKKKEGITRFTFKNYKIFEGIQVIPFEKRFNYFETSSEHFLTEEEREESKKIKEERKNEVSFFKRICRNIGISTDDMMVDEPPLITLRNEEYGEWVVKISSNIKKLEENKKYLQDNNVSWEIIN